MEDMKRKWTSEEDGMLRDYVVANGAHSWATVASNIGLGRSGDSCRRRWVNYLSRGLVRGGRFSDEEMLRVLTLYSQFGKRWARIAEHLPGKTDNDVKNFWNTRVKGEARDLGCGPESDEFRQIMTARLTERIPSAAAAAPPPTAAGECFYDEDWGHLGNGNHYTLDDVPFHPYNPNP